MNTDVVVVEISKFELGHNDYLAIKIPGHVSLENMEELKNAVKEGFPELAGRILLLWGDIEIFIINKGEDNADTHPL